MNRVTRELTKKTGKLRWKHEDLLRVDSSPVLIGDLVVFTKIRDGLVALHRKTGQLAWRISVPGCGYEFPLVDSGKVMISGVDQCIVVDPEAGEIVQRYPFKSEGGAIAATKEAIFVVVRTDIEENHYTGRGQLLCFQRGAKEPKWTAELGGASSARLACDESRCYVGDRSGQFLGIEQSDGSIAWQFDCRSLFDDPEHVWADSSVVLDQTNLLFSAYHRDMGSPAAAISLNKETGEKNWSVTSSFVMGSTLAKTESSVVAVTEDRTLVFMDKLTGELKFVGAIPERRLGGELVGVFADDRSVYVVGGDQRVWRFNASLASE